MSTLRLVTAPIGEPLTVDEMKTHLRITDDSDDAELAALIIAARRYTEGVTKRAFLTQTWDWVLDRFPAWFAVPLPGLQSVTSISYLDTANTPQVVDPATYIVDNNPDFGRIALAYAKVWPWSFPVINAVTVRFVAGYADLGGSPTDPASGMRQQAPELIHALKMLTAHFYENREAVAQSRTRGGFELMPLAYQALVSPYIANW